MRRFIILLETDVDFVDGDTAAEELVQTVGRDFLIEVQKAVQGFSHRGVRGLLISKLQLAEIKGSVSL
jgi:hypothetical protein